MLFLLGEEGVLSSFAETWRKKQTLAWSQRPDFKPCALCFVAEATGLCSHGQGEAKGILIGNLVLGPWGGPLLSAGCPHLSMFLGIPCIWLRQRERGTDSAMPASPSSAPAVFSNRTALLTDPPPLKTLCLREELGPRGVLVGPGSSDLTAPQTNWSPEKGGAD